jgi:hypothetical protein
MNRALLIAAALSAAAALGPAPAWADLTTDLCGQVSSRGGTITSEGVKTSFQIDTVEGRATPVPHCFIHGTVAEDSAFLVQLPAAWNGKYVLQMGGGVGGSEVAGTLFLLLQGYAHASSNQGRPAPVFEQADTWQELHLIRNHQLSQFVKGLIAQRYGSGPSRSYLYGSSGGAWRSLSQMERYPEAYDGAGIRNPVIDPRHIIFARSVVELYQPIIQAKMPAIIRARDLGEDPYALLTPEESEALTHIYAAYGTQGSEWAWSKLDTVSVTTGTAFQLFDKWYLDDFWTTQGYGGYEGEVDHLIVDGLTGAVAAVGAPNAAGWVLSFTDPSAAYAADQLRGWRITFTSGALAGEFRRIGANTATGQITIDATFGGLNGIAPGDAYVLSNRDLLAWQRYHRHIVFDCDDTQTQRFCRDGEPLYVQRPDQVKQAYTQHKAHLTGNLRKPVVVVAQGWDHMEPITMTQDYYDRVKRVLGSRARSLFRGYWNERTIHANPSASEINRITERDSSWHLVFQLMTRWVEEGIEPPAETVVSIRPGVIEFPATAAERKGLQPAVTATANGSTKIVVPLGTTVLLDGVAGSPIGRISKYEWDFQGNNSYDCDSDPSTALPTCAPGFTPAAEVRTPAAFTYATPGTYLPTVRVHDDTDNPGPEDGLENLARVVVVVE